jgi:L-fucose mutarotase
MEVGFSLFRSFILQIFLTIFCVLSEVLQVLAQMGHGDTIVIADGNFPSYSVAKRHGARLISMESCQSIVQLLEAVLTLFPLDTYSDCAHGMAMEPVDTQRGLLATNLVYEPLLSKADGRTIEMKLLPRQEFYDSASKAFAVIATSDCVPYGNIILTKGVLPFQS